MYMRINVCLKVLTYSDTNEEQFVFAEILKLVLTFKEVLAACCDHR